MTRLQLPSVPADAVVLRRCEALAPSKLLFAAGTAAAPPQHRSARASGPAPSAPGFFQIEITTVCNFRCFYCIGRRWAPRHMPPTTFEAILGRLPPGHHVVSLQGEGEPLAHPDFWRMAERVASASYVPYTITNGSLVDPVRMAALFPTVGFSLDTVDAAEAERIGRRHLKRVLARFDALCRAMGPQRIVVHSVDLGQNLAPLCAFLAARGVANHIVQPLQGKPDYRVGYPDWDVAAVRRCGICRHLARPTGRYFTVDGLSLPCAYIKDTAAYRSDALLRAEFQAGRVPAACAGCRELTRADT
jgi:hypothetical protein